MEWTLALERAQALGASYAEIRVERTATQRLETQDGELQGVTDGVETGYHVRALVRGRWGSAASSDLTQAGLKQAAERAVALAGGVGGDGPEARLADRAAIEAKALWNPHKDPRDISEEEKLALLLDLEKTAREQKGIEHVNAVYGETILEKEYYDTDGAAIRWSQPRLVCGLSMTAKGEGDMASRNSRIGGTRGWEIFDHEDIYEVVSEGARKVVAQLGMPSPKGGRMPVVIDPHLAGVFAHEAVGHASEADLVAMGESCFAGKLGETLGYEELTIRDDSTIEGAFGSIPFDDNGVPGQDKVLIENGRLVSLMADRERAAQLGIEANGACRAQDFHHRPLVRMSNTFIEPGSHTEEELFEGIQHGIYCAGSRGGQVDTARGTFLFNAQDAFLIENGEITQPLKDVSLSGDILTTLHNIDALGNARHLGEPGFCGKGQWVPVADGGPKVRIQDCLVGGQ